MFKKISLMFLTAIIALSACGTLEVTLKQTPTPATPPIDPTKVALEWEATAMRNFLTQQAATLWPPTPPPPTFIPAQELPILSSENTAQITQLARLEGTATVAWSPDGELLAAGSSFGIYLYNAETMKQQRFIDTGREIRGMAFSPDGRVLASVSHNWGGLQLWDVATGQLLHPLLGKMEQGAANVAFNPNGGWLPLQGGGDGYLDSVAFSPDGRSVATGSSYGVVTLWDAVNGQIIRKMNPIVDPITGKFLRKIPAGDTFLSVAFSPDGRILASGSLDGTIRLWDPASGQLLRRLEAHADVFSIAFSPDGHMLASVGKGPVKLWDTASGQVLRTLVGEQPGWSTSVAFSPDGRMIATITIAGVVKLWDTASGRVLSTLSPWERMNNVAFSPDRRIIAAGTTDGTLIYGIPPLPVIVSPESCASSNGPSTSLVDPGKSSDIPGVAIIRSINSSLGGGVVQSKEFTIELLLYCDSVFGPSSMEPYFLSDIGGLAIDYNWRYDGTVENGPTYAFFGIDPYIGWNNEQEDPLSQGHIKRGQSLGIRLATDAFPGFSKKVSLRFVYILQGPSGNLSGAVLSFDLQQVSDGIRPSNVLVTPLSDTELESFKGTLPPVTP